MSFPEFRQRYPRFIDSALTWEKYKAITNGGLETRNKDTDSGLFVEVKLPPATEDELLAAAHAYAIEMLDTDERYIRHSATWLNRGSWMKYTHDIGETAREARAYLSRLAESKRLRVVG